MTEDRPGFVREHWDAAFRIAFLLTQDHAAAEDLAQDALISALGALDRFDEGRSARPWVQKIAANKAYDWLRRRDRRPEVLQDEIEITDPYDFAETIGETAEATELGEALGRLDPRFRAVVVLRYLAELEPREIAEITGVPAGTVRTRVHRGLIRLHEDITAHRRSDEQAR